MLTEEVGELLGSFRELMGSRALKNRIAPIICADEMADVLFVLICLANQTGVDLTEAFRRTSPKDRARRAKASRKPQVATTPSVRINCLRRGIMSLIICGASSFAPGIACTSMAVNAKHFPWHNYVADFFVTGDQQDSVGRVVDFAELKVNCKGV